MSVTTDVLAVCDLRPGPWPPAPRTCAWCGTGLPARHRRWCSRTCEHQFLLQHSWPLARAATLQRDGHTCVRCHVTPSGPPQLCAWWAIVVLWCQVPAMWDYANQHSDGYRAGLREWERRYGPGTAHANAEALRWSGRESWSLEVNHRTPILGRHGEFGCIHHLDGLESLCHGCHVRETARQFGHRTQAPPGPTLFGEVAS